MTEFILEYKDAIPGDLCDWMIKFMNTEIQEKKHVGKHNTDMRKCEQVYVPLPDHSESCLIYEMIKKCFDTTFSKYKLDTKDPVKGITIACKMEQPSIIKYNKDVEAHFNEHADNWNDASAARQVSVIAFLNDVKEGGETKFTIHNKSVVPEKGKILMFPSFFTYPHMGCQPKSNDKYIVVTWYCYDGFTPFYRRM